MKFKDQKLKMLLALYERRFEETDFPDSRELLGYENASWQEAELVAEALESDGYVQAVGAKGEMVCLWQSYLLALNMLRS